MSDPQSNCLHHLTWHEGVELLDVSVHGEPFGKHSHDAFAIGVMEKGIGGNFCRGTKQVLPPGALSLMNPGELHDGYAISQELRYKMLYVSESAMRRFLGEEKLQGFHHYTAHDENGQVRLQLQEIHQRLECKQHAGWRLAVDTSLVALLEAIMLRHARHVRRSPGRESGAVKIVKEYLDSLAVAVSRPYASACGETITLDFLAQLVDLNPNYLVNVFTHHVGVSPYHYWITRRIDSAKILLAAGQSAGDVAHQLGFYDQSHFLRTFKRFTGVTPRQLIGC